VHSARVCKSVCPTYVEAVQVDPALVALCAGDHILDQYTDQAAYRGDRAGRQAGRGGRKGRRAGMHAYGGIHV